MNKLLLLILVVILLLSQSGCNTKVTINNDPADVSSAAAEIADFDLPAGYAPEFTAKLLGYTVAAYHPGDGHSHLYLIQSEKESDQEKLAEMLGQLAPGSSDPNSRLTVVESRAAVLRGQEATIILSDGTNSDGDPYRQVTAAFEGKGGPALLVLSEPSERWNQSTVDAFIASLR